MNDTIAAISTPIGSGGISVIRISGAEALSIAQKVFSKNIMEAKTHTIHYGYILENNEKIDEVLLSVMLAPRTFTRENVVEISTHGGMIITNKVLECIIEAGARPALAGEFTKRAFLNGRIDLAKAESVIDIINASNSLGEKNAFSQLRGVLSDKINSIRQELITLSAKMQVAIDYPDEELEDITSDDIKNTLSSLLSEINSLLINSKSGRILQDGIRTAIVGKPNVGKSSLLNLLSGTNRAIVTDIAGTTRDSIEERVTLGGIPLCLIDTAGIRETGDFIEKLGVEKSMEYLDSSELIVVVLDNSNEIDEDDRIVLDATKDKDRIIVINKTDIDNKKSDEFPNAIYISAKENKGMNKLYEKIFEMYNIGKISANPGTVVTNLRHISALKNAQEAISRAYDTIAMGLPQDLSALDIYSATDFLGEIIGATVSEDIVTEIFKNFCVGK